MAQEIIHERQPDTVVVHDHDRYDEPRSSTGVVLAVIALIVILLLIFFGSRLFGGGTTNVNVPKPTVNVPSSAH